MRYALFILNFFAMPVISYNSRQGGISSFAELAWVGPLYLFLPQSNTDVFKFKG